MTKSGELSSTRQLQLDWWTAFRDALLTSKVVAYGQTPRPQYWYDVALGRSGMFLSNSANANDGRIGVRVYLSERQGGNHALEQLLKDRASIEEEIGHQLQWNPNPENRDKTIAVYRDADLNNRGGWDEYIQWMVDMTKKFRRTFGPRVKKLDLEKPGDRSDSEDELDQGASK